MVMASGEQVHGPSAIERFGDTAELGDEAVLHAADTQMRYTDDPATDKAFFDSYERELLATAESRQTVQFVAQVAARTPISFGCFCGDETRSHRLRLVMIIQKHAPLA
jgi:uncharacterized protein YeaO (DUF488 family)